jgi:hypothetical protein
VSLKRPLSLNDEAKTHTFLNEHHGYAAGLFLHRTDNVSTEPCGEKQPRGGHYFENFENFENFERPHCIYSCYDEMREEFELPVTTANDNENIRAELWSLPSSTS